MVVRGETLADHLVISEVVTGGASASDELIELYNPTPAALPLEGLELVYVTASGATISRRAIWELGAPSLGAGRHLLVANELGTYAAIADATYASGMAATGGSVALRIQGATTAIDAVGWGTAASTWMEGAATAAPPAGSSLERLPGGSLGSTRDTDSNVADFVVRVVPDPQNTGSAPVPDPNATPTPTVTPEPTADPTTVPASPTPAPSAGTPMPTPSPAADVLAVASARALPDGTMATVEAVALTGAAFSDGGGYVADATGGIAVIVTGGTFDRGARVRLTGTLDDRFSQRTLRVDASGVAVLGVGTEPHAQDVATGSVSEGLEGELVRVAGTIVGSGTVLTTGVAFDLDDGSGIARLVTSTGSGIDVSGWEAGTTIDSVGVVGQRDSTGSGTSGYRVQPRDAADVRAVGAPTSPSPAPSGGGGSGEPSPSASPPAGVLSIAAARELPKNARVRVRGIVTLPPGVVDPATAVLQDGTGAIVLRLGDEAGPMPRGRMLEVEGTRSTKSGMETLRVTKRPTDRGSGAEPAPRAMRTGEAGEAAEAMLVSVRGGVVANARRSSSGAVSFEIDDGSGPLRVAMASSLGSDAAAFSAGTWVEVRGVLGQETTGAQPSRGYRIWPRDAGDVRVVAAATGAAADTDGTASAGAGEEGSAGPASDLGGVGAEVDPGLRVGATLVSGPWKELKLGGLLWDGVRLVALEAAAGDVVAGLLDRGRPPLAVELVGLRAVGEDPMLRLPVVRLAAGPEAIVAGGALAAPSTELPSASDPPRWVALVGRLSGNGERRRLHVSGGAVALDRRCEGADGWPAGTVGVAGIAVADPPRIVVPCGGIVAAPELARAVAAAGRTQGASASTVLAGLPIRGAPPAGRPLLPAGLLALAGAGLLATVIAVRRLGGDAPEPTEPSEASQEPPQTPSLTLVPLPHERAP